MTHEQFAYWLKGILDINSTLSPEILSVIAATLRRVLKEEKPMYGSSGSSLVYDYDKNTAVSITSGGGHGTRGIYTNTND